MRTGIKVGLSLLNAAAGVALIGSSDASAACRQVFTNTTCVGGGFGQPKQVCTNHFKQVCDDAKGVALQKGAAPQLAQQPATPQLRSNAGGNTVSQGGGNTVSQGGGNTVSQGGGNTVSQG